MPKTDEFKSRINLPKNFRPTDPRKHADPHRLNGHYQPLTIQLA